MHPPVVDPLTKHDSRAGYEFEQPKRFKKTCTARCGVTGLRCRLLEQHRGAHSNERGEFRVVAALGQTRFSGAELRDKLAVARNDAFEPLEVLQ